MNGGPYSVLIRHPDGSSARVAIKSERLLIGRSPQADIQLDDPSVSRQHAEIFRDPFGRWWVRDLKSRTGTRINGRAIEEQVIDDADAIRIGSCRLRIVSPPPPSVDLELSGIMQLPVPVADDGVEPLTVTDVPAAPRLSTAHLRELIEIDPRLRQIDDPAMRFQVVCDLLAGPDFGGLSAMVLHTQRRRPDEAPVALARADGRSHAGGFGAVSRTLLRNVCRTLQPAVGGNPAEGSVDIHLSISPDGGPTSAVACPFRADDDTALVLYVGLPAQAGASEWLALVTLAARLLEQAESAAREKQRLVSQAAIEQDLHTARELQQKLLPRLPDLAGLDVAIGFQPCRWVGGDYVDALPLEDGRVLLAIGDVCGKGTAAALVAGHVHAMVHAYVRSGLDCRSIMSAMNDYLCHYLTAGSLVTLALMSIDPRTGEYECVNAGHPPPLAISADGTVRDLQWRANPLLGALPCTYSAETGRLAAGQRVVLYTDGVTDLLNEDRQPLEIDGLRALLAKVAVRPDPTAAGLAEQLSSALDKYQGRILSQDDRTFLIARCDGGARPA